LVNEISLNFHAVKLGYVEILMYVDFIILNWTMPVEIVCMFFFFYYEYFAVNCN